MIFFYGITYAFDLRNSVGNRVTQLAFQHKAIGDAEALTLVMNNYRATGAGGFDCYLPCPRIREIQTEVSELLLDYFSAHGRILIENGSPYSVILPNGGNV